MGKPPKIIHSRNVAIRQIYPGVKRKRLVTRATTGAKTLMFSIAHIDPKKTSHSWHTHKGSFFDGEREREYPKNFEEFYFVLHGKATVFWRVGKEEKREQANEGDLIYFPPSVIEHQVVNTSNERMVLAIIMAPPFT